MTSPCNELPISTSGAGKKSAACLNQIVTDIATTAASAGKLMVIRMAVNIVSQLYADVSSSDCASIATKSEVSHRDRQHKMTKNIVPALAVKAAFRPPTKYRRYAADTIADAQGHQHPQVRPSISFFYKRFLSGAGDKQENAARYSPDPVPTGPGRHVSGHVACSSTTAFNPGLPPRHQHPTRPRASRPG